MAEKQIGLLVEIGQECHASQIDPSISLEGLKKLRLKCFYSDTSQSTIWSLLKKVQSLAPVEELDTDEYELSCDSKCDNNYLHFINQAAAILPNLKELKLSFKRVFNDLALLSLIVNRFKQLEGIGFSFPYKKETTGAYLSAFKDNALVSQMGKPIKLRALTINSVSDDQLQELLDQWPSLHLLSVQNASITSFPRFPHLERLTIDDCSQLTQLDLPEIRFLRVTGMDSLTSIEAPKAEEITILAAIRLNALHAEQAKHLMLHETGLIEVTLPSAKTLHFVPPQDTKVAVIAPKKITIPENCMVGRHPHTTEIIWFTETP